MADYTFDLDGTLCTQPHPTEFEGAEPYPDRIAEVNRLRAEGHRILIDTARGSRTGRDWFAVTARQLAEWGLQYDELRVGQKRGAEVYVDDRAIHPDAFFRRTLKQRRVDAGDFATFAYRYVDHLQAAVHRIVPATLTAFIDELLAARTEGATVYVAANGGSAASASHIANGLGFHLRNTTGDGFRVVSLTDNNAALTAIPNDRDFADVFVGQLETLWRAGDRLLAISCSGNSPNVVRAAQWVNARDGRVLGMLGFDGGALRELCDVAVHVPTAAGEYGPVEDAHMALCHALIHWFQG